MNQIRRCLHDLRCRRLRMSARNTLRSFRLPPATSPTSTSRPSRRPPKTTKNPAHYRPFHPVTSTLVILAFGLLGFFTVVNLTYHICTYFGL